MRQISLWLALMGLVGFLMVPLWWGGFQLKDTWLVLHPEPYPMVTEHAEPVCGVGVSWSFSLLAEGLKELLIPLKKVQPIETVLVTVKSNRVEDTFEISDAHLNNANIVIISFNEQWWDLNVGSRVHVELTGSEAFCWWQGENGWLKAGMLDASMSGNDAEEMVLFRPMHADIAEPASLIRWITFVYPQLLRGFRDGIVYSLGVMISGALWVSLAWSKRESWEWWWIWVLIPSLLWYLGFLLRAGYYG